ncbi:26S proteasome regulatory subunit 8-like [Teleopsis dalmanni]|uniref:26S proteasome regulatory subunit 8-like n=1 Tax=Teleopsis dalmanni TaxID=139649 RepID=UPI0018CED1F5|nr:26S proteasome regulatory subunit 8-like [Teleopsis dalmanni]
MNVKGMTPIGSGSPIGLSGVSEKDSDSARQPSSYQKHRELLCQSGYSSEIFRSVVKKNNSVIKKIEIPAPNEEIRLDILKIHSRKMNLTRGINLRKIAKLVPGASGAEVKGVCMEAGMYALRERHVHVAQEDFEMAAAKVMQKDSDKNMSIKKL